ncbi:phosphopantetheine-containing protein [Lonsdalea britannica]|uniref:Phosphopantetheine-containing protein n=1 Tax=Lonsdalea britannica TaxID=1082704 RepID=A0AAD0WJ66_9GAMM|nr:acyl carrier protein [Lonsdalea britannica]AXW85639.1 phosphopantetheine-containing protein [Lonsdalea britannica]OSM96471.1 phosphopantetheine-containing protein [Lonsdalea britannica]OSN08976.1 phosphopantetheine-containing protein [Lonsdalea britannica]
METLDVIKQALQDVLETPSLDVTKNTRFEEDLDLDSVNFVQFLLTLEDSIEGLMFDPDQISQHSFSSVGALAEWLDAWQGAESV